MSYVWKLQIVIDWLGVAPIFILFLHICRCSLAHYIHGMDLENAKRKVVEELFFPLFSALLDALLLRAQVQILFFLVNKLCHVVMMHFIS